MAKPDFSGEWILNRDASTLSPGADAVRSGVWRIEHREPTFRHQAAFVFEKGKREYEYQLQSDGPEVVGSEHGVRTIAACGGRERRSWSCGEPSAPTAR